MEWGDISSLYLVTDTKHATRGMYVPSSSRWGVAFVNRGATKAKTGAPASHGCDDTKEKTANSVSFVVRRSTLGLPPP